MRIFVAKRQGTWHMWLSTCLGPPHWQPTSTSANTGFVESSETRIQGYPRTFKNLMAFLRTLLFFFYYTVPTR